MLNQYDHMVISQDFFPVVGGAHLWLYQVYSRWPVGVKALVRDYSFDLEQRDRQEEFDLRKHGSLSLCRQGTSCCELNVLSPKFYGDIWRHYCQIMKIAKNDNIVLHCVRAFPEGFIAAVCKKLSRKQIKIVTYAHGEEIVTAETSRQLTLMAKFAYFSSDCIIANSYSTRSLLTDFCKPAGVHVVNPGVDCASFVVSEHDKKEQRKCWGVSDKEIVLVSISRMEPRKNHARVLISLAELRKEGLPVVCVFASTGEEKHRLEMLAKDLRISEYVHFLGYISDKERVLSFSAADIHVLPSVQSGSMIEGYGIVFIEAAAAGIPSIAGNVGGQAEAVVNGKTGIVIDGTDQLQLTAAIKKLVQNSEIRLQMGRAGRAWAQSNDWINIAEKTFRIVSEQLRSG